ncbi:protein of unknown function [Methylocaldum szegediense]|uniref:Uncharacterized protein n=1 Tax=Methylocaldum szegediense TaxID=73780 RepID=A0ABM9HWK8_9GAMM|nr:protein of unknown function [Methylocaldum szegediense]
MRRGAAVISERFARGFHPGWRLFGQSLDGVPSKCCPGAECEAFLEKQPAVQETAAGCWRQASRFVCLFVAHRASFSKEKQLSILLRSEDAGHCSFRPSIFECERPARRQGEKVFAFQARIGKIRLGLSEEGFGCGVTSTAFGHGENFDKKSR